MYRQAMFGWLYSRSLLLGRGTGLCIGETRMRDCAAAARQHMLM